MSDPPRSPKSIPTPSGLRIQTEERRRGEHRDHAVNRQPISRPDRDDAIPEETDWEKTPVHMSPLDAANFRAKRASNHSHMTREIAVSKVTQVRLELKADVEKVSRKVERLDEKVDLLAGEVKGNSAELKVTNGILARQFDAGNKVHEMALGAAVGAATAKAQAELDERKAFGAWWRNNTSKIVVGVLLPLATALITYFFATR